MPARSRRGTDRLQCLAAVPVILHVDDLVAAQANDLEQLRCLENIRPAPLQADDHTGVRSCDHLCSWVYDVGPGDALRSLLEDRPGLFGAVSARRVLPPQVSAGDASPFETFIEQLDKGLDVSPSRGVEGRLDALCISLHGPPPLRDARADRA